MNKLEKIAKVFPGKYQIVYMDTDSTQVGIHILYSVSSMISQGLITPQKNTI
ncbi:hypothetical protein Xish_01242 [Xenorhabdus ishibashii]|uniref:Uncharacterized protein n=1 Tax=Xenorhabdus ishibashii TaxID=1034471 RepID=A0A2D0KF92_9GAMM|nr:hypothetical protein Xish_01242 [Xenorhabdus ishibashii]